MGGALLAAAAERYERLWPVRSLVTFTQSEARYLFDFASSVGAPREDRTVAAWSVTPATIVERDISHQRGCPEASSTRTSSGSTAG